MATRTNEYRPDYAVPPGWVLQERLEAYGISHAEFARRCGRSPKLISEIIAGKAPLEPETALQFEKVLGVDASVWLGIEADHQLHKVREASEERAAASADWAKRFPIADLLKRECIERPASSSDAVSKLLRFFGVATIDAWRLRYSRASVAYRHSKAFKSDEAAVATWLRLGELVAESQECAEYHQGRFKQATSEVRYFTRDPVCQAIPRARELCNKAGVALAIIKPLPKTSLSGAAWWLSPRKAVIQLSARYRTDDHLWFTFFHECAHILLHSKKSVFVDEEKAQGGDEETEADQWACSALVPQREWDQFVATKPRSKAAIQDFADKQGIAPGIVVGMLQHNRCLPWSHLNNLKVRFEWKDENKHN
jgi:HTH-type transcriptional regulator/antitoxin HigA